MCGFDEQTCAAPVTGSEPVSNVTAFPWVGLLCSCHCA